MAAQPPLPEISYDDVVRFFNAKVKLDCPRCGTSIWDAYGFNRALWAHLPTAYDGGNGALAGQFPIVFACCKNCGFLSPHSAVTVANWLRTENERAPAGGLLGSSLS